MKTQKIVDLYRATIFILSLLIVCVFWEWPVLCFTLLAVLFIEMNRSLSWRYLKTSLVSSILGPVAEMIAVSINVWQYTGTQIFGVTLWLFPLWGIASLFFIALSIFLGEYEARKK